MWKTTFVQLLQGCLAFQQFCFLSPSLCTPVPALQAARPCLPQQGRGHDDPQLCRDPSARLGFGCASAPKWCQCQRELSSPLFSVTPHVLINDEVLLPTRLRDIDMQKFCLQGMIKTLQDYIVSN